MAGRIDRDLFLVSLATIRLESQAHRTIAFPCIYHTCPCFPLCAAPLLGRKGLFYLLYFMISNCESSPEGFHGMPRITTRQIS